VFAGCGGSVASYVAKDVAADPTDTDVTDIVVDTKTSVKLITSKHEVAPGEKVILSWTSSRATSVTGSNFSASAVSGTKEITATTTLIYWISVQGPDGIATSLIGVKVVPPTGYPLAAFIVTPSMGYERNEYGAITTVFTVDGGDSRDTGGVSGSLQYRWDWDGDMEYDTPYSSSALANYTYEDPGVKFIILQVKDAEGNTSTDCQWVIVKKITPTGGTSSILGDWSYYQLGAPYVSSRLYLSETTGSYTKHYGEYCFTCSTWHSGYYTAWDAPTFPYTTYMYDATNNRVIINCLNMVSVTKIASCGLIVGGNTLPVGRYVYTVGSNNEIFCAIDGGTPKAQHYMK
jgi:hypothetical protein